MKNKLIKAGAAFSLMGLSAAVWATEACCGDLACCLERLACCLS
jgi:hypothetical protein